MSGYWFAVGCCVALVGFLVALLRRRRLREKYAVIWLVVALGICLFGAFPEAVAWLSGLVGVQTPSNLLFALALVVLLLVCIQLSAEITTLEEETRTLTEAVALLRLDVERLAAPGPGPAATTPAALDAPGPDAGPGTPRVDEPAQERPA